MKKIRFFIALWGGKFFLWIYKLTGNRQDDKPGMASMRLFGEFLKYVKKPPLTIAITGTNGKTSISSMVAEMLKMQGYSVAYNDWGANHHAGQARLLLDAVNIFNKSTKDVAVVEADELIAVTNFPWMSPDYIIINNLARDSMFRNAHPTFVHNHLKYAVDNTPNAKLILNADDPLSCFLGEKNEKVYFGVTDLGNKPLHPLADDFPVCNVCGGIPEYKYRNYRHIGAFYCPECGLKQPECDYFVSKVGDKELTVRTKAGENTYSLVSEEVHNIYNTAAIIALFRELGVSDDVIKDNLSKVKLPASRETREVVNGIEVITHISKGQNPTASSTVFEAISKDPSEKEVIMILDEVFENPKKTESVCWIYDTDYEYLADEKIHRIVVGGDRYLDHKVRLLMAGVPEEKIVCVRDMFDTPNHLKFDGISKVYVLHDVNSNTRGRQVGEKVKSIIREGGKR